MNKFWLNIKKHIKANIIAFCIVFSLCLLSFFLYFYLTGPRNAYGATNALLIGFVCSLALLGFYLINYFGMFDTLVYGFSSMRSMFSKSGSRKYHDLIEYRNQKAERHKDGPVLAPAFSLIAILFGIGLLIAYIFYKTTFGV